MASSQGPRAAGFSRRGCLNQTAPPLSLFSYVYFLSTGPFNYISFQKKKKKERKKKGLSSMPVYSSLLADDLCLTGHSPVSLYNTALLYIVLALCGHLQTQCVCRALHPVSGRMGSWWLRSPVGSNTLLRPGLLLDVGLGWPDPINRLVVLCPNFD